jgi:cobyrinic acid a,c-diamide synthase
MRVGLSPSVPAPLNRMPRLPRIAVGALQPGVDWAPLAWGLLDSLERRGLRVQTFLARACFEPHDGATVITGRAPRHLDSWLMTAETCREAFLRGTETCDVALVEGRFASAWGPDEQAGGQLEEVCSWLDLPRLAIVDAARLGDCRLPERPSDVAGLLLDRVANKRDFYRLQTQFESLWGIPVLGGLEARPHRRAELAALPVGVKPPLALCRSLGESFRRRSDIQRICRLAAERDFAHKRGCEAGRLEVSPLKVAIAYDAAFHCYFPDALDALEARGATLCDFSPIGDERLPAGTDLVYFGCGRPEQFARALADNHCLISSLREHVCNGLRVYGEGGGLAYLCEHLELPDGARLPMAGILPAVARVACQPAALRAVEIEAAADCWLAPARTRLRGYLNSGWAISPTGPLAVLAGSAAGDGHGDCALVGRQQVIGSRLHINFAAQPAVAERFFASARPDLPAPV